MHPLDMERNYVCFSQHSTSVKYQDTSCRELIHIYYMNSPRFYREWDCTYTGSFLAIL